MCVCVGGGKQTCWTCVLGPQQARLDSPKMLRAVIVLKSKIFTFFFTPAEFRHVIGNMFLAKLSQKKKNKKKTNEGIPWVSSSVLGETPSALPDSSMQFPGQALCDVDTKAFEAVQLHLPCWC